MLKRKLGESQLEIILSLDLRSNLAVVLLMMINPTRYQGTHQKSSSEV